MFTQMSQLIENTGTRKFAAKIFGQTIINMKVFVFVAMMLEVESKQFNGNMSL